MIWGNKTRNTLEPQHHYAFLPKRIRSGQWLWLQRYWRVQIGTCPFPSPNAAGESGFPVYGLFDYRPEAVSAASRETWPKPPPMPEANPFEKFLRAGQ